MWWMWAVVAQAEPFTLDYVAEPACPTADRFADEVAAKLGRPAFGELGPVVQVRLGASDSRWTGSLRVSGNERTVSGAECHEAFDHLVASVAVWLDAQSTPPLVTLQPAAVSDAELALRTEAFRRQRLQIVPWRAAAPWRDGVVQEPFWAVVDGNGVQHTTSDFLRATSQTAALDAHLRLQRQRRGTTIGLVSVGLVSMAGAFISVAAPLVEAGRQGEIEHPRFSWPVTGVLFGTSLVTIGVAGRLSRTYARTESLIQLSYPRDEAQTLIDDHNDALLHELELTEAAN